MTRESSATQPARRSRTRTMTCFSGTASIGEVAIKVRLGRPDFVLGAETIATESIRRSFAELIIRWQAAAVVADLPLHHRDPFDRILLAQAVTEPVHFYTVDRKLTPYSPLVVLA